MRAAARARALGPSARDLAFWLGASILAGCAGASQHAALPWGDGTDTKTAGPAFSVRWTRSLAKPFEGRSVPVERSGVAADPAGMRLYVGSTEGVVYALSADGSEHYRYDAEVGIEAPPAVDPARDQLFVAAATGTVHALVARSGNLRWKVELDAPVSAALALSADAVYIATADDSVTALARTDGEVLWRFRRPGTGGFKIAGTAGLLLQDGRVVTGFGDGVVIALDASDGRKLWQVDTSLDLPRGDERTRFTDVDTTPVQHGEDVYAASFSGGLYVFDAKRGAVKQRFSELTGIVGLALDEHSLIATSGDLGVICLDLSSQTVRWRRPIERGAPGQPRIHRGTVYVAESSGALLALSMDNGSELGRIESGHGFDAAPELAEGRGFVLSNGGTLFAFTY